MLEITHFLSITIFICSALLAIFGWKVVYKNARKLASRNETHTLITQIISQLDEVINEAIQVWSDQTNSDEIAIKSAVLTAKIHKLKRKVNLLKQRDITESFASEIIELRQAITLNIESKPQLASMEAKQRELKITSRVNDIIAASSNLHDRLYLLFYQKYPST